MAPTCVGRGVRVGVLVGAGVRVAVGVASDASKVIVAQAGQAETAACGEQAASVNKDRDVSSRRRSFMDNDPDDEDYGTSVMAGTPTLLDTS